MLNVSIRFIASNWVSASGSEISPQPCARKRSGRAAVMLASFCAATRGRIARVGEDLPPDASCRSLSASKSSFDMYTSRAHLQHVQARAARSSGLDWGMSAVHVGGHVSPTAPSPRVAARTSSPRSYRIEQDRPSILGSAVIATKASGGKVQEPPHPPTNSATSSSEKAFSRLSIGRACATLASAVVGAAPSRFEVSPRTRWETLLQLAARGPARHSPRR